MKKIAFLVILSVGLVNCQKDAETINYHPDFVNCSLHIESLQKETNVDKSEGTNYFLNGKPYSGCARSEYPAKDQYLIYTFSNGFLTDELGYYYNGNLARAFKFENGLRHGIQYMYHEDGSTFLEEFYKKGNPSGLHRQWHPEGGLARRAVYKKGKLKTDQYYDRDGKLIHEGK